MKNRCFARFVLGSLVALLPVFLSAGPWDPNRPRPAGFQRTLGYLANDLYDYPRDELRSARNSMLNEDMAAMAEKLKGDGHAPATWEALGQQGVDAYRAQYESVKTTLRQTKNDPEGIIQAVEGNQPLSAEVLEDPLVHALILVKWQILGVAERTYQCLLHENLIPGGGGGGGGKSESVPSISPPKPGKGKPATDWKKMREARRRAIERRRAFEERVAREARERANDIFAILTELLRLRAQSSNKFQARPAGGYAVPLPASLAPSEEEASAPGSAKASTPTIEEIEKIDEEMEEAEKNAPAEEPAPEEKAPEKVTIYSGTLELSRPDGWGDDLWEAAKKLYQAALAKPPAATDMKDMGNKITWRYKLLKPGGHPAKDAYLKDIPDKETTQGDPEGAPAPEEEKPKAEGNDADPEGLKGKDLEGSGPQYEPKPKPAAKPAPAKPEAKPEPVAKRPGYWYDPTDASRKLPDEEKSIYVRIDGMAVRMTLKEAREEKLVPEDASISTMTHYSESKGKVVKDGDTHRDSTQPQSTNKFAKPKPGGGN